MIKHIQEMAICTQYKKMLQEYLSEKGATLKEYLFVYGSMKKGFQNHKRLLKEAEFICDATTLKQYPMFPIQHYMFPCMMENKDKLAGKQISGELYLVSTEYIKDTIDVVEGVPTYYIRKNVDVKSKHGDTYSANVYFYIEDDYDDGVLLSEWSKKNEQDGLSCVSFCNNFKDM